MVIELVSRKTFLFLLAPDWPATRHHFQTQSHCGPGGCRLERIKLFTVIKTWCSIIAGPCMRSKQIRMLGMARRCGTGMAPGALLLVHSIQRVPRLALTVKWFLNASKSVIASPECHSQVFIVGRHIGVGLLCHPLIPNKCKHLALVSVGCQIYGVVDSKGVYHGDMWLPSEHCQVDSKLLDVDDKIPE
jgi:hypothetical protein